MDDLPVFTIASENKIIATAADQLEKMLREYYIKFKNMLIGGFILVITGVILLLVDFRGEFLVYSALFTLAGVVLIYLSFARKVRIKRLDVVLYPVLVAPYGDGSKSLVVDIINMSGDEVEFKYPRVDLLGDELRHRLNMLKESVNFFINLGEQNPPSTTKPLLSYDREINNNTWLRLELSMKKESGEAQKSEELSQGEAQKTQVNVKHDKPSFEQFISPTIVLQLETEIDQREKITVTTLYPELPVTRELMEIRKTLASREYDIFSFRLFKSGVTISAYPLRLLSKDSLLVKDMGELVEENIHKINMLLETLRIEYSDLLETVVNEVEKAKNKINDYYKELEAHATTICDLMARAVEAPKVRICRKCFVRQYHQSKNIFLTTSYPILIENERMEGGVLMYRCPDCGSIYSEFLERTQGKEHVTFYWLDILQSKVWSKLYERRLDEINRYMSEARKQKSDLYHEAMRQIHAFTHQFKSQLMPIYVDLTKVLYEIQSNNDMLYKVSGILPKGTKHNLTELCESFNLDKKVIDIYEKSKKVLIMGDVESVLSERTDVMKRLNEAKKLKIDQIYLDEVAVKTLKKVYEKLRGREIPEQISEILGI